MGLFERAKKVVAPTNYFCFAISWIFIGVCQ
jgi:hypothetical protein